ncbi:MAG: hypothetical protein WD066_11810 [Planctomycetaceae bacterium]
MNQSVRSLMLPMFAVIALGHLAAIDSHGAETGFTAGPTVTKNGERVTIAFAVSAPVDCAVYVYDAEGKVVRHLAAGMLGEKAAAPFQPGLAQSLEWDGLDDRGVQADGGPFQVRVGLGLMLEPERLFAEQRLPKVQTLAVGPGGELFALGSLPSFHKGDGTPTCRVYARDGKYLRTIMPWPAELPAEKMAGFRTIEVAGQGRIPFVHHGENRSFYPGLREPNRGYGVVTKSGTLHFVYSGNATKAGYAEAGPAHLFRVESDGGCPPQGFVGPRLAANGGKTPFPALALSPDEKILYATGFGDEGTVWKLAMPAATEPTPFIENLDDPRGLAVDGAGNVYVAERGKNRIVAYKPDGTRAGEVAVDRPDGIAVHRKTGAIYALMGGHSSTLVKISGLQDGKVVATIDFPVGTAARRHAGRRPVLALDDRGETPVVWVASLCGYSDWQLQRVEVAGDEFTSREIAPEGFADLISEISIHPEEDLLLVRQGGMNATFAVLNPRTGDLERLDFTKPGRFAYHGDALTFGGDGHLYFQTRGTKIAYNPAKGLYRYALDEDRLGTSLAPWSGDAPHLQTTLGSLHMMARGMHTNARGDGAMLIETRDLARRGVYHVLTFGPDGRVKEERAISGLPGGGTASVRIDNAGNIYVADASRPHGHVLRPELTGQVPAERRLTDGGSNWYPAMTGSIIKFKPGGGRIGTQEEGTKVTIGFGGDETTITKGNPQSGEERILEFGGTATLEGAIWQREVVSLVPLTTGTGGNYTCSCEQLRFALDGFGRVFAPDTLRFQLAVVDTNGELIGRFGNYGNRDEQRGESRAKRSGKPALRFAWPRLVAANDHAVYVYDDVNGALLRAPIAYATEKSVAIE